MEPRPAPSALASCVMTTWNIDKATDTFSWENAVFGRGQRKKKGPFAFGVVGRLGYMRKVVLPSLLKTKKKSAALFRGQRLSREKSFLRVQDIFISARLERDIERLNLVRLCPVNGRLRPFLQWR